MNRVDGSLWVAAAVSVIVAGYLHLAGGGETEGRCGAETSRARLTPSRPAALPRCEPALHSCESFAADCRNLVASCEAGVDERRSLAERFETLPAGRHQAEHWLEKFRSVAARFELVETEVECRGAVCRLRANGDGLSDMVTALQTGEIGRLKKQGSFHSEDDGGLTAYFEVIDGDMVPGRQLFSEVEEAFVARKAARRCFEEHGDEGEMVLQLRSPREGPLVVEAVGGLRRTPTGACVLSQMQALVADHTPDGPISVGFHQVHIELPG